MEKAIRESCHAAASLLNEYAPVEISCERYAEREPHPTGQDAFTVRARLPWQRTAQTRLMIEITRDEKILKPARRRSIIHGYGEPLHAGVRVYALEEIVAEKLRAILQQAEALEKRGWARNRARDYYDLWRILSSFGKKLDLSGFTAFLHDKCAVRSVSFRGPEDFFPPAILAQVRSTWEQSLGPLVPGLPSFTTVVGELQPQILRLLAQKESR